jgi:hypothetical protein
MRLQTLVVGKDSEMEVKEVEAAEMVTEEEAVGMEDLYVGVVASLTLSSCLLFHRRRLWGVSQWQLRPLGYRR